MKLTKRLVKSGSGIRYSSEWISNGHWAVKRELIDNKEQFTTPEAIIAAFGMSVEDINEKTEAINIIITQVLKHEKEWTPSGIFLDTGDDHAEIYLFEDQIAVFRINLLQGLGIENEPLCGEHDLSGFHNKDNNIILMPSRGENALRIATPAFHKIAQILKAKEE